MRRAKRHKVKEERPETSTAQLREREEHDLAYYIHDRVELMHQVFTVLKYKELRAMAPECVRHISTDDLQELCTEELLGISSKRLCAVLDGADPPSDTESSSRSPSPDNFETISLDSISSDEEILSQASSKKNKKHKHRRRDSKEKRSKTKEKKKSNDIAEEATEQSRASRAGLTVLELLELQARARAIRAQLQQEQQNKVASGAPALESSHHSSDGEVEIKEEPAEVVEISSDEEKPKIKDLQLISQPQASEPGQDSSTVTKRISDLIITVPQSKPTRKIKLNRNKVTVTVPNVAETVDTNAETSSKTPTDDKIVKETRKEVEKPKSKEKLKKKKKQKKKIDKDGSDHDEITLQLSDSEKMDLLEDLERKSNVSSVDSDSSSDSESDSEDSDTEKAGKDDVEAVRTEAQDNADVNKKQTVKSSVTAMKPATTTLKSIVSAQNVVSSKSVDSPSQSSSKGTLKSVASCPNDENSKRTDMPAEISHETQEDTAKTTASVNDDKTESNSVVTHTVTELNEVDSKESQKDAVEINKETTTENSSAAENTHAQSKETESLDVDSLNEPSDNTSPNLDAEQTSTNTIVTDVEQIVSENVSLNISQNESRNENLVSNEPDETTEQLPVTIETNNESNSKEVTKETESQKKRTESEKDLSEGELTGRESSEIEAVELRPEVVCISDDENPKGKKKKKEKKCKKVKKSKKKKSDFREGADQNFYKDSDKLMNQTEVDIIKEIVVVENTAYKKNEEAITIDDTSVYEKPVTLDIDTDDDVYEILELSDDSSCYEVEGTVLSKEPTAEEIEALSAKIDEIDDVERAEIITEEEIREYERREKEKLERQELEVMENISWKDRYLDSKKVKRVLSTSNILNALRKRNRDLKKKLEESKKEIVVEKVVEKVIEKEKDVDVQEGSIDQYNTLEASTKFVYPVKEVIEKDNQIEDSETQGGVTREMKKDAKQLLKMYKRLLKYNDMNKEKDKDPNKKRKKKKKDKKKCETGENKVIA